MPVSWLSLREDEWCPPANAVAVTLIERKLAPGQDEKMLEINK